MSSIVIFVLSFLFAHSLLLIELMIGIGWDFHPDSVNYVLNYRAFSGDLFDIPNNFYFFVSGVFGGSMFLLIELNIIVYSATNAIACKYIQNQGVKKGLGSLGIILLISIFIFQPYRAHLAVHILKDTFIIFFLVLSLTQIHIIKRFFAIFMMILFRVPSMLYIMAQLRGRFIAIGVVASLFFLILFYNEVYQFLMQRNLADMGGRTFDKIPDFTSYGLQGTILRMVVWPIITLTGVFLLISPSLFFLPIALEVVYSGVVRLLFVKGKLQWFALFSIMCLIAALVNSYTAYIRYLYPLICIFPLLLIFNKGR